MFAGLETPVVFLQNVVTDLILGLGANEVFAWDPSLIMPASDEAPPTPSLSGDIPTDIAALGLQAHGQCVDGSGQANIGRAVSVDVIAQHQRAVRGSEPVGDGGDIAGQVEASALCEILGAAPGLVLAGRLRSDGNQKCPRAAPCGVQDALPERGTGQVNSDHPGAPAQQRGKRTHLGACPEHGDRAAGQGEPLRVRRDRPDRSCA